MINWCEKLELKIQTDIEPCVAVRMPLPSDDKETRKDKQNKPYICKRRIMWEINYLGSQYCFVIPKGFTYDAASIPYGFRWIIGAKASDEFMVASLVHDWMCIHHECIGNDRQLSSMVFREVLISSGVSKIKAQVMYRSVDIFQKYFGGWEL